MKLFKKVWIKFIELIFPGTYDEYLEAERIHKNEIKIYRKNPQFLVGIFLYLVPLLVMIIYFSGWKLKIIALSVAMGDMLMRDAISEHYCALINKERKQI